MNVGAPNLYDLVVGGAGPGGLATAIEAQQRGLRVLVLEQRPERPVQQGATPHGSRKNVVRLRSSTVESAARWKVTDALFDGRGGATDPHPTSRIGHVERTLLDRARAAGVDVRFGTAVEDVARGSDGLTHVRSAAGDVVAPLFVDARGRAGSEELRRSLGIRTRHLPGGSRLAVTHLPPQPAGAAPGFSWRASLNFARAPYFQYGTPEGLTLTVRTTSDATPEVSMAAVRRVMADQRLAGAVEGVGIVDARPTMISRTAVPGIAFIGDAAGTVHPITGQGLNQALRDARQAALLASRLRDGMAEPVARALYRLPVGSAHARHALTSSFVALPLRAHAAWMGAAVVTAAATEGLRARSA